MISERPPLRRQARRPAAGFNQSAAANRRPAGQLDGAGNLAAIVAADRAYLALLGIGHRTLVAHWTPRKRVFRLLKPYPAKPSNFGEQLRKRRLDAGLTQLEVAASVGVSKSAVDKWECNWTTPPKRYHRAIAAFLGFHPFEKPSNPTPP